MKEGGNSVGSRGNKHTESFCGKGLSLFLRLAGLAEATRILRQDDGRRGQRSGQGWMT